MTIIVNRGEVVYRCTVCNRKIRIPKNKYGLDKLHYCTITAGCQGKLHRVTITKEINETPALPPEITGVQDWFQRTLLYTHNQAIASKNWTIEHNLGSIPIVHTFTSQVVDGESVLVDAVTPPTTVIDENNIVLNFSEAVSGVAQLEALASRNLTNATVSNVITPSNIQYSTDVGNITIATISSAATIGLTLAFVVPGIDPIMIGYNNIGTPPDANSAWTGVDRVYIGGEIYTVRSFNFITHIAALNTFLSGLIPPSGGSVYIVSNTGEPVKNNILLLGATSPFTSVDRVYNKYVDFGAEPSTTQNILYSYGKLYAVSTIEKSIYPYISVV